MRNHRFWLLVVMLAICTVLHYPRELLSWPSYSFFTFLGLTRHALERVILTIPIAYAGFVFGIKGGMATLTITALIMLPRALSISLWPADAVVETIAVLGAGAAIVLWFNKYQQNRIHLEEALLRVQEAVTEQKATEQALLDSEGRFRSLFENAPDAVWVHDLEGNIQMANKAAEELTGYATEELLKKNFKSFLSEESLNLAKELQRKLLQNQPADKAREQRIIRKDGTEAICIIATDLIRSDGEPKAFQSIAVDVTAERQMGENLRYYLREITKAQEEERKRIARELHDGTIQTLIALLYQLENLLTGEIKLSVKDAKGLWGFYEQVRDVVQEVRRFSRDLRPSILDDLGLLPALEWLTEQIHREYGIKISLKVIGNERRLSQEAELLLFRIVQEALRNTVNHAEASEAEVKIEFVRNEIMVTASDNGIGFEVPEDVGVLLQIGKLGLAGLQERARLLGGSLELKSELGKGTTVTVHAPV